MRSSCGIWPSVRLRSSASLVRLYRQVEFLLGVEHTGNASVNRLRDPVVQILLSHHVEADNPSVVLRVGQIDVGQRLNGRT